MAFVEVMVPYLLVKHTEREDGVSVGKLDGKLHACEIGNRVE